MRALRNDQKVRRWLAVLLCVCIMLPYLNGITLAAASGGDVSENCEHHPVHTEECGYAEAVEGHPCGHVHDETCGFVPAQDEIPCDKGCGERETDPETSAGEEDDPETSAGEEDGPETSVGEEDVPETSVGEEDGPETSAGEEDGPETSAEAEDDQEVSAEVEDNQEVSAEAEDDQEVSDVEENDQEESAPKKEKAVIHDPDCAYRPAVAGSPCTHVHDETCGYVEAVEAQPCMFVCEWCVIDWQWDDGEELLVWNGDVNLWGLGLPGASEANPISWESLAEILPQTITAETAAGPRTVDLIWDHSTFPDSAFAGNYILTASLSGEYVLTESAPALEVLLELGGGEMYVEKYLNEWSWVVPEGTELESRTDENGNVTWVLSLCVNAISSRDALSRLLDNVLPKQIYAWGTSSSFDVPTAGFKFDKRELEHINPDDNISYTAYWGWLNITWDYTPLPSDGVLTSECVLTALNNDYFAVNGAPREITIVPYTVDLDLAKHTVSAAQPENVTVNLFDYWVDTNGAEGNDLLPKSGTHINTAGVPVERTSPADWNKGINIGHLLLFGDGNIHAGFWNKGAGAATNYGKTYAGMMGIIMPQLGADGYPVINTEDLNSQIDGYGGISDWELCGDHDDTQGDERISIDPKNISNTVQNQWNGDASLAYLFEPENGDYKRAYTDVQGLFQLDAEGYYYYDMRQNFAELTTGSSGNSFILYDAPAVERTDRSYDNGGFTGGRSVGNFLPFNTGAQVFDGIKDGKLYSSENIKTDNKSTSGIPLNHHLGMTVEINFRQPEDGTINMGAAGNQPMSFQFSGDDDVWVFIDDVLVLDLGGIHSEIYGTIDFSTGDVYIGQSWKTNGFPRKENGTVDVAALTSQYVEKTNLYALYAAVGQAGSVSWKGNTFADNTDHTLKMFFLERGNYDSSLAVRFNLQPLLYQEIKKVDQNGNPIEGIEFELYQAEKADKNEPGALQCLYTDSNVEGKETFYVKQLNNSVLATLTTDKNGVAQFKDSDGKPFDFSDNTYYILKETNTPAGYRALPIDIVLRYDSATTMLSVANRWTTGAYACSTSHITGAGTLTYGSFQGGDIKADLEKPVDSGKQSAGLIVAVPMLYQQTPQTWEALYGGNLSGFTAVSAGSDAESWRKAVLTAVLEQAKDSNTPNWHLDWDAANDRLVGTLDDLPGLASRYQLNNADGDMRMVYGIIEPAALAELGIGGDTATERYEALHRYLQNHTVNDTLNTIMGVVVANTGSGKGFSFLNVDQFNRNFRALVYIPNEQRELRVWKVDQNGEGVNGAKFGLYRDKACTDLVVTGQTATVDGRDGVLVFAPYANGQAGYAEVKWANADTSASYYLKEISAPSGYEANDTVIPIIVGAYAIYADAGAAEDGVKVMAGVGRLTQTMRQYAANGAVDITLRDITAFAQRQESGKFDLNGWEDMTLDGTEVKRSMNLHYGLNAMVDYGLHDEDGGKNFYPFFVTDTGFIRTRVQQNYPALLPDGPYEGSDTDTNKDNLGDTDLTNLFSLLNVVVVTDEMQQPKQETGQLTISKTVKGSGLEVKDYTKLFKFTLELVNADGNPLTEHYQYYFYGQDKSGYITNKGTLLLHHDESVTILGLPVGAKYTVVEEQESGWSVDPADGTEVGDIQKDTASEAHYTNTLGSTPTPTPSGTPDPGSTPTPTPSGTPGPGGTPTPTPSGTPGPGGTPTPTPSGTPGPGGTPTPTPSGTPGPDGTPPPAPSGTPGPGGTPTPTPSGTPGPDSTPPPAPSSTPDPGSTPLPEPSVTPPPEESPDPDGTPPPEESAGPDGTPPPEGTDDSPPSGEPQALNDPDRPYPTELPDPNDPDSPDTITILEDGVPKTYIKVWDPENEEWVYILDDEVPLAPMTGDSSNPALWGAICLASLVGLCILLYPKKKNTKK